MNVGSRVHHGLLDKLIGNMIPARFLLFAAVGTLGLLVHLTVLALVVTGQRFASVVAMTFDFLK